MYILPPALLSTLATSYSTTTAVTLTTREALSGAFGSISLTCWLCVLLPQVIENYRNQSGEALSLTFLCIWLLGDITNLLGGVWAGLVPTVIAIAIYFCFQDMVLLGQCLYYGIKNRRREGKSWLDAARQSVSGDISGDAAEAVARIQRQEAQGGSSTSRHDEEAVEDTEDQPLLKRTASNSAATSRSPTGVHRGSVTIPGSARPLSPTQRRASSNNEMFRRRSSTADNHLAKILEDRDPTTGSRLWLSNILGVIAVFIIGAAGWFLAYQGGAWKPQPLHDGGKEEPLAKGAQILGYISAVAYLGARIPQIIKNWREQSCEGLSLLFFILSLFGNLTYGASILFHSTERSYVIKNVPWLIGSMGTMVEDITIFVQFHMYGTGEQGDEVAVE